MYIGRRCPCTGGMGWTGFGGKKVRVSECKRKGAAASFGLCQEACLDGRQVVGLGWGDRMKERF